jgi:hypothetical protein
MELMFVTFTPDEKESFAEKLAIPGELGGHQEALFDL